MKLCLPLEKNNLDSLLSVRFKEARYFLFIEDNYSRFKIIVAPRKKERLPFLVTSNETEAIITGNIDPEHFDFFKASGIKIYAGVFGITGREAIRRFKNGELEETIDVPGTTKGRML